jgi:O-antigen/teichoic acid export membrane protein
LPEPLDPASALPLPGADPPALPRPRSLAATTLAGFGWLFAQNIGARLIGFLAQIILARIFAPSDFAILALAGTVTSVVSVVANFGVDDALLQRQRNMRYWQTPALFASVGLSLASMLAVMLSAPLAAKGFHAPLLLAILPIMGLAMPLGTLSLVPEVQIRASMNFRFLATYSTIELIASQIAIIGLALAGLGVFAFVLPAPVLSLVRAVVFWSVAKPRLGRLRFRQLKMITYTGSTIFGTKVITAIVGQGDYFTLGLLAAKPVVGAYFFAFRLAIQPVQMLAGNLSNVLFPALAQLHAEPARQKEAALTASRVLGALIMPYCFLQAAVARPVILMVFGAKWIDAIPLIQILSIGLAFDAVSWVAGALLSARGEFKCAFFYSCVFSPPFFIVVIIGAKLASATGVAVAVSAFYAVLAHCYSYAVFRRVGVALRDVASIYVGSSLFAAVAMGAAAWLAARTPWGHFVQAGVTVVVGCGLYAGLVRLFTPATFRQLQSQVSKIVQSKRGLAAA